MTQHVRNSTYCMRFGNGALPAYVDQSLATAVLHRTVYFLHKHLAHHMHDVFDAEVISAVVLAERLPGVQCGLLLQGWARTCFWWPVACSVHGRERW